MAVQGERFSIILGSCSIPAAAFWAAESMWSSNEGGERRKKRLESGRIQNNSVSWKRYQLTLI